MCMRLAKILSLRSNKEYGEIDILHHFSDSKIVSASTLDSNLPAFSKAENAPFYCTAIEYLVFARNERKRMKLG